MIILCEICVWESQTVLRISAQRCQTAKDFFTKTFPKKIHNQEKVGPQGHFQKGYFCKFWHLKRSPGSFRGANG